MPFTLKNLNRIYNIPSLKSPPYNTIQPSKTSIINQCRQLTTFKYSKHVPTTTKATTKTTIPSLTTAWSKSPSSSSILSSIHLNHTNKSTTLANKNMMILQQPQKRNFMWWRIPVLFLTMSSKKRKMVISGLVSGTALLGFILGPLSLLVVGSIAGFITMRLWRQTRAWWRYLPTMNNAIQNTSLYSMLRMQVGQHRAEDHVRALTIQKIKSWAHTDQGKRIFLNEFNVDHVDDLNFLPNHATATFTTNSIQQNSNMTATATETKKQISIQFCVESEEREDSGGIGGCMVTVDAYVDPNNGNISFRQIKLSSPAWATDEFLPLDESRNRDQEKVIEGEFKNV